MPGDCVGRAASLAEGSFLRHVDPRTKIALALAASATVALPLPALAVVAAGFVALLWSARLLARTTAQVWRTRWWLGLLFLLDAAFVGGSFALLITLRLALLTSSFTLVFATTTPDELRLAGERLGLSTRLAFAFATAFHSLALVEREWRGIREAQQARGIAVEASRGWRDRLGGAAALVVPAIVLAAQRAWSISEAAAARGFGSPARRPYRVLHLHALDHALLAATAVLLGGAFLLR